MITKNKNKWFYSIERWKGYIPSDKIHKNKTSFETGFKNYFLRAEKDWKETRKINIDLINNGVDDFVKDYKIKSTTSAIFYFNFNFDGLDVFVNRCLDND